MGRPVVRVLVVVASVGLFCGAARAAGPDEKPGRLNLTLPALPPRLAEAPATQPAAASRPGEKKLPPAPPPKAAKKAAPKGWWGRYTAFWDKELERIIDMDLWGQTTQLPKGYLTVKYQFNTRQAVGRRDKDGNKVGRYVNGKLEETIIPPIAFGGVLNQGQANEVNKPCLQRDYSDCLLAFDAGASGQGGSHEIMISYGVTGRLDYYLQIPMQYHKVRFNPRVLAIDPFFATAAGINYQPLDRQTVNDFFTFVQRLGRPAPKEAANLPIGIGDINTGFSWNFFRTKWISSALTYRLYLPTARLANADNSLAFFTGPDLDTGNHAFAMGAGMGHDFRLPNFIHKNIDIVVSLEWNFAYAFPWERPYPSTCANVYDRMNPDSCRGFRPPEAGASALFDPNHTTFPDLSTMKANGSTYTYTPGFSQDVSATLNFSFWGVGVGVGVGQSWAQKPEIDGNASFIAMVDALQLVAPTRSTGLKVALHVPLFPLNLPATLTLQYQHDLYGANAIYFKNNFYATLQGYIPDAALFKRDRRK
ncbi:MAG: hypothetical protein HY906_20720 [Deltaproteobacteria bacterium]|nr:hypothetical protein [Deltaproteobacteria bacterium]